MRPARTRAGRAFTSPPSVGRTLARDVLFLASVTLYVLVLGENWGIYAAALMIGAYRNAFGGGR